MLLFAGTALMVLGFWIAWRNRGWTA